MQNSNNLLKYISIYLGEILKQEVEYVENTYD